jgi:hypothetical protein
MPQMTFYHSATSSSVPPASTHSSTGYVIQQHTMMCSWQQQDQQRTHKTANNLRQLQLDQSKQQQVDTQLHGNKTLPALKGQECSAK